MLKSVKDNHSIMFIDAFEWIGAIMYIKKRKYNHVIKNNHTITLVKVFLLLHWCQWVDFQSTLLIIQIKWGKSRQSRLLFSTGTNK